MRFALMSTAYEAVEVLLLQRAVIEIGLGLEPSCIGSQHTKARTDSRTLLRNSVPPRFSLSDISRVSGLYPKPTVVTPASFVISMPFPFGHQSL